MDRAKRLNELLDAGFNCAESMVAAFAEDLNVDREAAIRSATSFGAGMGRSAKTCGLVSGGAIVIGLALGRSDPTDVEAKERAYKAVAEFVEAVEAVRGSTSCTGILGADLTTDEGRQLADESKLYETNCHVAAGEFAEILERLLASRS